jgi:hypothetical protein
MGHGEPDGTERDEGREEGAAFLSVTDLSGWREGKGERTNH